MQFPSMKVLFFAQARQAAGRAEYTLSVTQSLTQADFWTLLVKAFPPLATQRKTARLARHETYLQEDELLHPDDVIAVLPPVSGG